jgi:hypothetical protein
MRKQTIKNNNNNKIINNSIVKFSHTFYKEPIHTREEEQ